MLLSGQPDAQAHVQDPHQAQVARVICEPPAELGHAFGGEENRSPTTMMYTVRNRIKRISRWLGIARTSQPSRLISLTYTLIYSARTDLDADIPADIPGNAIRELADRLVKEARQAEEARLRLELVVLALQRLKPVG
jgi:hypothetical protein